MDDSNNAGTSTQLQVNERNGSNMNDSENADAQHHQNYPKGSLLLKNVYLEELSGFVKSLDTRAGVYTVQLSDNTKDLLTEFPMKNLIVDSPESDILKHKWIPCKDQHIYVKVGTIHCMRIQLNPLCLKNRGMLLFDDHQ